MATKVFKSIEQQIEILVGKELVINNIDYAKDVLLRENYFFLMGYRHSFLREDGTKRFIKGTTFEELYGLFIFDRMFRNIIFKNILIVENNYKSIFSYVLSKKYGYKEHDYLNIENFDNRKEKINQINDLIRKLKRQFRVNGSQHGATSHYMNNYGYIPLWVGIKVLSFGLMSELFSVLKAEDKNTIAKFYKILPSSFETYLPIIANYRNLCAHEDILFDHFTQRVIPDTKYHEILGIEKCDGEYVSGKNDALALLIMLKQILRDEDFRMMMTEINYEFDRLSGKLTTIKLDKILKKMGLPSNYKDIVYIK